MRANPILLILLCCAACTHRRAAYAIRDFPDTLQPWLTHAINTGIVSNDDTATLYIQARVSDSEIIKLSYAENPILRAIALEQMIYRKTFNHPEVVWSHLDDTAIITMNAGEWGVWLRTVSDYMISRSRWKTEAARDSLAEEILLHHDQLYQAYITLLFLPPRPEYHDQIKALAGRENYDFEGKTMTALSALAKYHRKEDVPFIREKLMDNVHLLTQRSFQLMAEFPDTGYVSVLESFYPRSFYHSITRGRSFLPAEEYIRTLASYKCDTCAKILADIPKHTTLFPVQRALLNLRQDVLHAIWDYRCPAYRTLLTRYATDIRNMRRQDSIDSAMNLVVDQPIAVGDTSAEPIRW